MDEVVALPPNLGVPEAPPLDVPPDHIALDTRGPDPLDAGFVLSGGVLAPLPARVRLPHEDDEQDV
jgi:hypothetical protein